MAAKSDNSKKYDATIHYSAQSPHLIEIALEQDLQNISEWCNVNKMVINFQKTKIILIGHAHNQTKLSVQCNVATTFIEAAEKGDASTVRQVLLTTNVNPDLKVKAPQSRTALHIAAGYGQTEVVEELVKAGADVNITNTAGRTALHEAASSGNAECLQLIMEYTGDLDVQDRDGLTAPHCAAKDGEVECLKCLADRGANLVIEDNCGRQPAHLAAVHNKQKILECLFDRGVDLECVCEQGKLPFHYAAQHGALASMICLVERDSDMTIGDNNGNVPAHYAARHNHLDCLRFLVKQGTAMDIAQGEGKTLAHTAAQYKSINCLHWLMEKGVNPNIQDAYGNTPAHYAAQANSAECFNCCLQHGASLEVDNDKEETPLQTARRFGCPVLIDRAVSNEQPCPMCYKKMTRLKWERDHAPAPVERGIRDTARRAYTSPLKPSPQQSSQPVSSLQSSSQYQLMAKKSRGPPGGATRGAKKKELPKRDLVAKYFGEYLEGEKLRRPEIHVKYD